MSDSVKMVFKTLIKIPIIIMISYLIANILFFSISYFKILGVSYIVMQTAIKNNFIPATEQQTLETYMNSLETGVLENVTIRGTDFTQRRQYGESITVGVEAHFNFILPLMPTEYNGRVSGLNGTASGPDSALADARAAAEAQKEPNIVIEYTIPGMKYYPDLN